MSKAIIFGFGPAEWAISLVSSLGVNLANWGLNNSG